MSFAGDGHSVPQFHIPAEVVSELERLRSLVVNVAQDHDLELKRLREQVAQLQGDSTPVERPRVHQRLDLVSIHARFDPSRIGTVDGGPAGGSSRGPQFGRHQSHFGVDFEVERGRRTVGGDERWHVAVTRQSLYGFRGVRIGEASHPGPRHKRRRRVVVSSETSGSEPEATLLDALEQDLVVQRSPPLKWRTVPIVEGGEFAVRVVGAATHHDLTLVDSSDDDAPFVVSAPARPSRRLVLVPESVMPHSRSRTVSGLNRQLRSL